MSVRASTAIVRRRLRDEPSPLLIGLLCIGLANALRGTPSGITGPALIVVGVALTVAMTLRTRAIARLQEIRLFAAPLYGRQLARAHAIVPCLTALAFPAAALATSNSDASLAPLQIVGLALAVELAVLIALSGALRSGGDRALYAGAALAAGWAVAFVAYGFGISGFIVASVATVTCGYFALRALGETLARYDPID